MFFNVVSFLLVLIQLFHFGGVKGHETITRSASLFAETSNYSFRNVHTNTTLYYLEGLEADSETQDESMEAAADLFYSPVPVTGAIAHRADKQAQCYNARSGIDDTPLFRLYRHILI